MKSFVNYLFSSVSMLLALLFYSQPSFADADCRQTGCSEGYRCNAADRDRTYYICQVDQYAQTPRGPSCVDELNALVQACQQEVTATSHSCDEKRDSGMSQVGDTASQLSLMFGSQTAASIQAACSKMAGLTSAANAAVAAYRLTCSSAINSCKSACGAASDYASNNAGCINSLGGSALTSQLTTSAQSSMDRCESFDSKVEQANQAIANFAGTMQNASQCALLTSGDPVLPEICKTNPSLPGCTPTGPVDCTNPAMAGSKVCICSKNPMDPSCLNQNSASTPVVGGSMDSSSRLNAKSGGSDILGDLPDLPPIAHGKVGGGGAGEAIDGKQGGGAGISSLGGGGGGVGGGGGGAAAPEDGVQVTAGFYGAGGGSMGGSGGSYGGGAAGARGIAGNGSSAKAPGQPDLTKFLPGGQFDPKRGVSGMAGSDGITGPHSNIWQKIQNRYRVMAPTLLP